MGIRRVATMVVLVAASAAAAYFVFFKPRPVRAHAVDRGEAVVEVLGTGSIESRRTIDLGFEVTARVVRLDVDQGDLVKKDQELAAVDPTTFRAAVAVATENLKLAEAAIERLASDVARGEAVLEGAEANIRRVRPLVEERVTSPDSLDIADERLKVAVADLARASAAKIEGDRRVRTVQRTLEQAEADLARTVARSPFDGLVLKREREVGDVAVPGAPVLRLAAMDVVWASVWVD
ncbi:MAG: efflux RND transporter periplasmic adaptor subunit, partial [Planctomycetes bacterium]|nr:efflux RND transporter periplasmic adaptor subunit [Planctomycetota bacterium]